MKKLLLSITILFAFNICYGQIATGVNNLQAFPWRTFANDNMVGLVYDGSQYRMYGFNKYSLLDTTNATGRFATKYDVSLKTNRSQTITINGATYDLSGNRSWTVGDVSSSGSYSNPNWITALAYAKITGAPTNVSFFTNDADYLTAETDPVWNLEKVGYRTKVQNDALYQPIGAYLTTEVDPTVPSYSKSLTAFSIIKSSTDPLYKAIGYTPSSGEITSALGYTPVSTAQLNTKLTIPTGTTSQVLNGQGVPITLPAYVPDTTVYRTVSNSSSLAQEQAKLNTKQNLLVSGTNLKTVNGNTLLGSGDLSITPYTAPVISTPTMVLGTSYQAPANKNIWINASITHTIALTLILSSGSSSVQLQTSPNNSTWTTINSCGFSDAVAVAVALNKTVTNNVSGEVPPNFYYRLLATTSGAGSAAIVNQQLKTY